jgi:hypothetical protein
MEDPMNRRSFGPRPPYISDAVPGIAYPPEHMPPEHMPHSPRARRARRWPWISLGVILGVLLIPCACCSFLGGLLLLQITSSNSTLVAFCQDLTHQHYHDAYDLLSPPLRAQTPLEDFIRFNTDRDATLGPIRDCGGSGGSVSVHNDIVTLPMHLTREHVYAGSVTLVTENGARHISALDPALMLLPPT